MDSGATKVNNNVRKVFFKFKGGFKMISKRCTVCGKPLNQSQWDENKKFKSCPKCSTENGEEHVYYEYPENFGTTEKRVSSNYPDGPQSYCVPCRGSGKSTLKKILCSHLK